MHQPEPDRLRMHRLFESSGPAACNSTPADLMGRGQNRRRCSNRSWPVRHAARVHCRMCGYDVVEIMKKQRTPLSAMSVRVEATRVSEIPRRLASAVLHFSLTGAGITPAKAARAVELSVTKYCSVRSSLISDAPVTWTIEIV